MFTFLKKLFSKSSTNSLPANPLWDALIVGKIIKAEKHPNADRLKVCTVDCGSETRTIVCGGVNVREGMLTVVGKPGVKVHLGGEAELTELKPAVIRGVASDGMLCGPDEIELNDRFPKKEAKEIIDLSSLNCTPGTTLSQALAQK